MHDAEILALNLAEVSGEFAAASVGKIWLWSRVLYKEELISQEQGAQ